MPVVRSRVWAGALTALSTISAASILAASPQSLTFEQFWNRPAPDAAEAAHRSSIAARTGSGPTPGPVDTLHRLRHWTTISIDASGVDHAPPSVGYSHEYGHHLGPGRAARAHAIVAIAIFEAVNAVDRRYESYLGVPKADPNTSIDAAIAQAAHDTLNALFPSQSEHCDKLLDEELASMKDDKGLSAGIELGRRVAAAAVQHAANDGSDHAEALVGVDYFPGPAPGEWRQDPISRLPVALGVRWGQVRPLVIPSGEAFRVPPPPELNSPEYKQAFKEVQRVGGDGIVTKTTRSPDQTMAGLFWAYDGSPTLGTPPRLYNQIAMHIAEQMGSDVVDLARLLALINVGMSDAGIACWESKYHYKVWRPVTGIREADEGTGPSGLGDGNPATQGDAEFTPLGAPASNNTVSNFTPPFPAYPSGHSTFGAVLFQTLRRVYQTDNIPFTIVSDELNGVTLDNRGEPRPLVPRTFSTLSEAEEENGQSRVYLGIHWAFDKTAGIAQGRQVADYVFQHAFQPKK
jgi:PAP2 superfamily